MWKRLFFHFLLLLSVQMAIAQATRYECWIDNDYQGRTIAATTQTSFPLELHLDTVSSGLHYFNFRAQDESGQWGGLSRYLFFLKDSKTITARYEYWLDNDYNLRTTVSGTPSAAPISIELSTLKPGLHYFNFRTQGISGQWGALSRYLFFIQEDVNHFAGMEYWIDNDHKMQGTQDVAGGKVIITLDISELEEGSHEIYLHGRNESGYTLPISTYNLVLSERPVVANPEIAHDSHRVTITTATEGASIYYTMDGTDPTEESALYTEPIELTKNCIVKALAMKAGYLNSQIVELTVDWFKVATPTFTVNEYTLTISTETEGADIHFTTDGAKPTAESTRYEGAITLTEDCTVKAIALKEDYKDSEVATYNADWVDLKKRLLDDITVCEYIISDLTTKLQAKATPEEAPDLYAHADYILKIITETNDKLDVSWTLDELKVREDEIQQIMKMLAELEAAIDAYGAAQEPTATPVMALDHATGSLTISCSTKGSTVYYSINGTINEYSGAIMLTDNSTVSAWATAEGLDDSAVAFITPIQNGTADGSTFRISGAVTTRELLFLRNVMGSQVEHLDMTEATLTDGGLGDETFRGMGMLSAQLPKSVGVVGNRLFNGCRRLAAVVWNATTDIMATALEGIGNPNLLLYVGSASVGRNAGVRNRIVNGVAQEVIISDPVDPAAPSDYNFFCPIPFTAIRISYSHIYTQQTGIDGNCRGWESLALPFDVQQVEHRVKGAVAPFGSSLAAPHFWLYDFGGTGFATATEIMANKPYIIAMPQHPDYAAQYCLGGDSIIFSATNTVVPATAPQQTTSGAKTLHANFTAQAASSDIFAINIGDPYDATHPEGSIFVSARRALRPFEAYTTTTANGVRFIELFSDEANGIMEMEYGRLIIDTAVYDLQGRKQDSDYGNLRKGLYITGGRKKVWNRP